VRRSVNGDREFTRDVRTRTGLRHAHRPDIVITAIPLAARCLRNDARR
jgi:hypothetical protein